MADDSGSKWKKIIFIVLIVLFLIIILITLFVGIRGLKQFFTWLLGILLVLAIIFGLLYIFYTLFIKKEYKDIPHSYRKKLVKVAKLMKNEMFGDLYLSGDTKHNRIKLGKYLHMRIQLPKQVRESTIGETSQKNKSTIANPKEVKEFTQPVPVDCFVIQKKGFFDKMFSDPMFILVKPSDHDYSSIFNDVTIKGFNLVPVDSQFFTIDRRSLDIDIIKGMATNYIREVVYEIFRDLDRLVKQSINLDQQFQKDKQKGLEFEIPQMGQLGGGQDRR